MLKYLYKTLLVSFLCGSLLLLDFSYKGNGSFISSAQAETVKTEGIKDGDLMSTLTMTSVGLIASRLYSYKMTTDTMIAAAGGALFIAGEILAFMKLKKVMKDMETEITRDKNGNIDQKQIETLEKLKQSYVEAKGTATTKKNLQMAAAAAFAAAAVAAIVLKSSETLAFEGCQAALTSAGTSCPTASSAAAAATAALKSMQAGREAPAPSMANKTTETAGLASLTTAQAALATELGVSATAYAVCPGTCQEQLAAACTAAVGTIQVCTSVATTVQMTGSYGVFGVIGYHPIMPVKQIVAQNSSQNVFANLSKFFISDAHADLFSPMGIASSLAIKFLLATNASLGTTIDTFLFTPMKRAMAWGVLSGLTFGASSATDGQIQKIESNIQKIDAIINQMRSYQNGVANSQSPNVQNAKVDKTIVQNKALGLNTNNEQDLDLKANGINMPCITGDKSDKCPSFSNQLSSQADFKTMPDSMQSQLGTISKLTDGINGSSKITSTTFGDAKALAGQANAIAADMAKKQKELQAKLKASGSDLDLAKEKAKLEATIRDVVQKELDKNKMSAGEMLASFGGGSNGLGSSSGSAAVATDANKNAKDAKNSKKGSGFAIPVVGLPAATLPRMDDKSMADSLKADADKAAAEAALTADAKASSIDDYELKNDITKDKDSSIFELISNRYQKSGYPRLFKRIK
jgi:hypothetical protein